MNSFFLFSQTSNEQDSQTFKRIWDKYSQQSDVESRNIGYSSKEFQRAIRIAQTRKTAVIHYHPLETVLALYTQPTGTNGKLP